MINRLNKSEILNRYKKTTKTTVANVNFVLTSISAVAPQVSTPELV